MRNIGSDSEMHRHRNFRAIGVCKDARFKMFGLQSRTGKKLARRFAEPDLAALRTKRSFVEENAGFLGHSEFAITKNSFHIFGSAADQSNFKVMDECGAVHCDAAYKTAIHEVNQQGAQADLDDVAPYAPENCLAGSPSIQNRITNSSQIFSG